MADSTSGRRKLRKFSDLTEAKAEAHRIAVALCNGDSAAASLTFQDAATLLRCRSLLEGLDVTLEGAVELFAEAARAIGPHRVVEAAKDHARRFPVAMERISLTAAADEYHAALEARGRGGRHLADVRARLGRFLADHPGVTLDQLTTRALQAWVDGLRGLDGKPLGALSRRNFAGIVTSLLEYHRRRGRIADNPAKDIERPSVRASGDVQFWNPAEALRLLQAIEPAGRNALAVGLFCGCRTAEIARLTRGDFNFEAGDLAIGSDKSKTASRRLCPIPSNLREWLAEFEAAPKPTPLWAGRADRFPRVVTDACLKAGVRRVENGARHSFITHAVAVTGEISRVALWAGNSTSVIHSHYRGLCRPDDAQAYFNLRPGGAA